MITVISLDAHTAPRLPGDGRAGEVHSVHERVVNVLTPGRFLFCLATASLDDAPRTLRIPDAQWSTVRLRRGAPVAFLPGVLAFQTPDGPRDIAYAEAARWQPGRAALSGLTPAALREASAVVDAGRTPLPQASPFDRASRRMIGTRAEALDAAIRAADSARVTEAARGLIGLGTGLTPAGDDLLAGLAVLAAADGMQLGALRPALWAAVDDVASRTTAVSAATLVEAVGGRGRQRLHDLLDAIAAPRERTTYRPALVAAVASVREIGHTSGTDLLAGLRLGLAAEASLREHALTPTPATGFSPAPATDSTPTSPATGSTPAPARMKEHA